MTDGQDGYRDERRRGGAGDDANQDTAGSENPEQSWQESPATPDRDADPSPRRARRRRSHRAERLGEPAAPSRENGQSPGEAAVGEEIPIEEYTTDRRSLASVVQVQWAIGAATTAVILGAIATFGLTLLDVPVQVGALSVLGFLALGVVWVGLRYRVWVYQVREDAIYLERGVVTHVRTLVPYVRIQHVDTSRGPIERALGLSTLVVYTAGSRGADVSIPGLRPHEASDLQQRIKELAIEAEGDDAL